MATWNEAGQFTWDEMAQMNLTWNELNQLPLEHLLPIAKTYLKRFQQLPEDAPMPDDLEKRVTAIEDEVGELKSSQSSQPTTPRRLAEGVFASLVASAVVWAVGHSEAVRTAILEMISIIRQVLGL